MGIHRGVVVVLSVGVVGLSGCAAATQDAAAPVSSSGVPVGPVGAVAGLSAPVGGTSGCQASTQAGTPAPTMCMYLTNTAQVFTGPNVLGPANLSDMAQKVTNGSFTRTAPTPVGVIPPSELDSGQTGFARAIANPASTSTTSASVSYPTVSPGVPLGQSPSFVGTISSLRNGTQTSACTPTTYWLCTATVARTDPRSGAYQYTVSTLPVTIAVANNMGATLASSVAPVMGGFLADSRAQTPNVTGGKGSPAAPGPASLSAATNGLYGAYRDTSRANSWVSTYLVGPEDPDRVGTTVTVTAVVNQDGSTTGTKCDVQPTSSTAPQTYCDVNWAGSGNSPMVLNVNVHP